MRVLLLQSWLGRAESPVYPIGLACIAAYLCDHEVRIVDPNVHCTEDDPYQEITALIHEWEPDCIGISLRNIDSTNTRISVYYYDHFQTLLKHIRKATSAYIVVGGAGFSLFSHRIMEENPEIDFGIYLEGEATFVSLLENIDTPGLINGVYYRDHGDILFTGPPEKMEAQSCIDVFKHGPPLHLYPTSKAGFESIGIESKRGCALRCIYCPYGFLNGKEYRLFDPSHVVNQIKELQNNYGIHSFTFLDSVFNIPLHHAEGICDELIRQDIAITWSAWFNERYMSEEFIRKCLIAGCHTFIMSPDGFTDESLVKLGKAQRNEDIVRTWRLLKKTAALDTAFEVSYNFFKNPPGQTWRGFAKLLLFVVRAKIALRGRVHFEINTLRVEPHTELANIAVAEGMCTENTDLLQPTFYTQKKTRHIERIWNTLLHFLGK